MKLWSGRFTKEGSELADDFNSSLSFDIRLYEHDIKGSIAHATMLSKCGIITPDEAEAIISGLNKIAIDIEEGALIPDDSEDVHMFVEAELTKRIGETGKKLHTARSRNDQVATDMRLYVIDSIKSIKAQLHKLLHILVNTSEANVNTYMPGFTHMQKAQPISLAHHLMAYAEMFTRDLERLNSTMVRISVLPLGSCALAGTPHPINRELTSMLLEIDSVSRNSMDSVSDRDFVCEYIFDISLIMMHLSRFCEEIITWASDEYKYIDIDDSYATGSSIMPQKKNPDMAELIRGKTGRVYGDLMAILTVMKGLPLAYNKDMQEDKEAMFDAEDTVVKCLDVFIGMFSSITFNVARMESSAKGGYTNATDVADYLVSKGVPFRTAHEITGKLVLFAIDNRKNLEDLSLEEFNNYTYNKRLFEDDIYYKISLKGTVNNRKSEGGTAPESVLASIAKLKEYLITI